VELYELMDGRRTVSEILVEHLQRRGYLALDRLATLTANLAANGFFGEARVDAYARLRLRRAMRDPLVRLNVLLRRLIVWNVATWSNAQPFVDAIYRWGGRLAFTRPGAAAVILLSAIGIVLWWREFSAPHHDLFRVGGSVVWGLVALTLAQVLSISVHEAGHALAVRHFGRRVRRLGVAVYYMFPCFYVDATDMVMAPRRQRVIVSLAGPVAGVTVAALAMLLLLATKDEIVASLALKAATLLMFQFAFNLLPILDLDGYHVLVDALDAPLLRQRAMAFVRGVAPRKLRLRQPWTRAEALLAAYGALAIGASLAMLLLGAWIWQSRVAPLAGELLATGAFGAVALALVVVVFLGPIVLQLAARLLGLGRTAIVMARRRSRRDERAVMAERVALLGRVRFLSNLTPQALTALADHIREERAGAGDVVVTYGETADRFFILRSGLLEAIGPDARLFNRIIPGEGFGELALLDGTPRTATVRAVQPSVLWTIDRGHFNRWVRDRFEVAARIRAFEEERARFARVPFFRDLGPEELQRLATKLVTRRVAAGEYVFQHGEPGDRYYVIREGTVEVIAPDGHVIRTLGPDQDFGELALLFGTPRTASVRAVTEVALMGLARKDFATLVKTSGETMGRFRERTAHYESAPGLGSAVAQSG